MLMVVRRPAVAATPIAPTKTTRSALARGWRVGLHQAAMPAGLAIPLLAMAQASVLAWSGPTAKGPMNSQLVWTVVRRGALAFHSQFRWKKRAQPATDK